MGRPTLSVCCIAKNEINNIDEWHKSFGDIADEVIFVDTGSTDGTRERAVELGYKVYDFEWIKDFSAARNFSFSKATSDYILWCDLDDSLPAKEAFLHWRDHVMDCADYWYANYDYASDANGNPVITFVRERVVKRSFGIKWHYFVHEGLIPDKPMRHQLAITWKIKHRRSAQDVEKDKGRNLALFEANKDKIDNRMKFYYGKELFEAGKPMEAYPMLLEASIAEKMELHDRILSIQYGCYAAIQCNQYENAAKLALTGLGFAPTRAEFHVVVADSLVAVKKIQEAIPFYWAAANCLPVGNSVQASPMFSFKPLYTIHPLTNLAKCYFTLGDFYKAQEVLNLAVLKYNSDEARMMLQEVNKAILSTDIIKSENKVHTDDIVISTPPNGAYEWDSSLYKKQGMGGSETAAIEIATYLKLKTGRNVIIFNERKQDYTDENGVEYRTLDKLLPYMAKNVPYRHIAWRHNVKLTDAPTYAWCHDLFIPTAESKQNFEKLLCLSDFHKNYVMGMQGIPSQRIIVTRNGIETKRFKDAGKIQKIAGKVIFASSPDRGLDRAIAIMDEVVKVIPHAELHVFYGMELFDKYGLGEVRKNFEKMFRERPYIKYHGKIEQKELANHFMESEVWLYPTNFLETFCITALEAVASRCYPVVRNHGALANTLAPAIDAGMCDILDKDATTDAEYREWASHVISAITDKKWQKMNLDIEQFSWESVSEDFIKFMEIEQIGKCISDRSQRCSS